MMATRWKKLWVEMMLDYRDRGLTEEKIAAKLNLIFMTDRFTKEAVNSKIKRMKESGELERNERTGRFTAPSGVKREGENYEKEQKKLRNKGGRPRKNFRQQMSRRSYPWDGFTNT